MTKPIPTPRPSGTQAKRDQSLLRMPLLLQLLAARIRGRKEADSRRRRRRLRDIGSRTRSILAVEGRDHKGRGLTPCGESRLA